jgi:hypothetical protein
MYQTLKIKICAALPRRREKKRIYSSARIWARTDATLNPMDFFCRKVRSARSFAPHQSLGIFFSTFLPFTALFGCASPGPPRSPSLNLPQPVSDLTASRTGNIVELRFTVPHLSTDKLPLFEPHHKAMPLHGTICRELKPAPCITITNIAPELTAADHATFTWHETLPESLASGSPHLLVYRVEFLNKNGKSAGTSNPAFTASGSAPAPVANLHAEGTRGGVLLQWTRDPSTTDILLHRIDLGPKATATSNKTKGPLPSASKSDDLWLNANSQQARTLDASVTASTPYRYTAVRRELLTLDKHPVELRSDTSPAVEFTLQPTYAPAAPTGLEATGFAPPDGSHFAVDLIWQPVNEAGITNALAAPLSGYNVYREQLGSDSAKTRLTATPAPEPSFRDATAEPHARYRYSVTAVDGNGNESKAATFTLEPSPQ